MKPKTLLFVCTGNTCRSPMAEIMCNAMIDDDPRFQQASWRATSAGLQVFRAEGISENAAKALANRGLLSADHLSRQLDEDELARASLVLTMTAAQRDMLREYFPEEAEKVFSLKEFAGEEGDVLDPYGGPPAVYERTAQELEGLVRAVLERLSAQGQA